MLSTTFAYAYTLLPSADTGDCSNGVTVTLNGLLDVPPTSSNVTSTNLVSSEPAYSVWLNCTFTPITKVALIL